MFVVSGLAMERVHLSQGLSVETKSISGIDLSRATVDGPVNLIVKHNIQDIALRNAKLSGPFQLSAKSVGVISGLEAEFSETTDIQAESPAVLRLERASLAKGLRVKTLSFVTIDLRQAVLLGNSVIETKSANTIFANNAQLQGEFKIQTEEIKGIWTYPMYLLRETLPSTDGLKTVR